MAVYRPATGQWFVQGGNPALVAWGTSGDRPVPADYDGNTTADVALNRPSTGGWYVRNGSPSFVAWGATGDVAVTAFGPRRPVTAAP